VCFTWTDYHFVWIPPTLRARVGIFRGERFTCLRNELFVDILVFYEPLFSGTVVFGQNDVGDIGFRIDHGEGPAIRNLFPSRRTSR
jgi:hypothetical protein